MAWLRIDDGFTANSKISQLSDSEFRCWMRVLCHCAKTHDPTVDRATVQEVAGLTPKRVERYAELVLLDPIGDGHEVHDWEYYLPKDKTNAERQARYRARQRNAKRNGQGDTARVTPPVTDTGTEPLPRARAHADSRPVPNTSQENASSTTPSSSLGDTDRAAIEDDWNEGTDDDIPF